jgi:hypothetical protein
MANVIAVTEAIKSLTDAESRLNLQRNDDEIFFAEWQADQPDRPSPFPRPSPLSSPQ